MDRFALRTLCVILIIGRASGFARHFTIKIKKGAIEMNEEVMYYYLRDQHNHPRGCVAMSVNPDGTVNRGVSLCSTLDVFNRAHARGLALSRLNEAIRTKKDAMFGTYKGNRGGIIHNPGYDLAMNVRMSEEADYNLLLPYKSHYAVRPNKFEMEMLKAVK